MLALRPAAQMSQTRAHSDHSRKWSAAGMVRQRSQRHHRSSACAAQRRGRPRCSACESCLAHATAAAAVADGQARRSLWAPARSATTADAGMPKGAGSGSQQWCCRAVLSKRSPAQPRRAKRRSDRDRSGRARPTAARYRMPPRRPSRAPRSSYRRSRNVVACGVVACGARGHAKRPTTDAMRPDHPAARRSCSCLRCLRTSGATPCAAEGCLGMRSSRSPRARA